MSETLNTRVGRVIAGSVHALLDRIEDQAPEAMMEQSIRDLAELYPAVQSVSVAPVGLTRHHKYGHRAHTPAEALADLAAERALSSIVLQQVSQHLGAGQVVDCDDLVTLSIKHLTESQTANTTKTIDSNSNSHVNSTS